jgi:hypothetical protein
MRTDTICAGLELLFSELADGATRPGSAYILNSGDAGFLKSIDRLTATEASRSTSGGATIAAHVQHVRYGLSLMNRWGRDGGNPFADAKWDEAWKTAAVDDADWAEIRAGVRHEAHQWLDVLRTPRHVDAEGLNGMMASIAHLAYHLGAIRQIATNARGPREGTFG